MPTLSLAKARALRSRFSGRITETHAAHAEFTGKPPVMIPETAADVGRALGLADAAGRVPYVRSGHHTSSADINTDPKAAVISLEAFKRVEIDLHRVHVGAAATVGDVATALLHRPLFLPLDDVPTQTIVGVVLGKHRSAFPRSGGRVLLAEGVVEAEVVRGTGDGAQSAPETLEGKAWRAFQKSPDGIVTSLTIDATRWDRYADERWLRAWMLPYSRETFEALCTGVFGGKAPARVDVSVRVSTGGYATRLIVIRATGQTRARSEAARRFVQVMLNKIKCHVLWSEKVDGAGSSIAAWVGTGPGRALDGEVHDRYSKASEWPDTDDQFFADVDRLVAAGAWVDVHLGSMFRRAFAPVGTTAPDPTAFGTLPGRRAKTLTTLTAAQPGGAAVAGFTITSGTGAAAIPGFRGEIVDSKVNDKPYKDAIKQYATSSYDAATVAARMHPRFVVFPLDGPDVACAVSYAASQGLKVVGRSGGHQYCGLSSGGLDTMVVDLRDFERCDVDLAASTATVGAGVALTDLNDAFVAKHVSIPHGECPLVNLGGHVQTGGVGHQLRSLGLALDWVRSFKMVTLDPTGAYSEQEFTRPPTDSRNDDIFKAVLGGGPGSWGVLTEITFDVAKDKAKAYSDAYGYTRAYCYEIAAWAAAMDQMRLWSEQEATNKLPAGVDLFVSVISGDTRLFPHTNLRPGVLLIETTALTKATEPVIRAVVDGVAEHVSLWDSIKGKALDLAMGAPSGKTDLSAIVGHGVRSTGAFAGMPKGREFLLPYKKSLYVTRDPLPAAFCDRFVALVDRVYQNPDLRVVFQGVIGGGKFEENSTKGASRMQHRNALAQLVFDVFYRDGHAAEAQDAQNQMRDIWEQFVGDEGGRMFWGTFEDEGANGTQLDMGKTSTQARYYDSLAEYADLRRVKAMVDPNDIFHTSFTVQR